MANVVANVQGPDGGAAVRQVNDNLRGPVADILARHVPELHHMPAGKAYDRTLNDIGLLQRCFEVFRARRDEFRAVLVDAQRRPVEDDHTQLNCGRTLEQVVAMIVRTAAKRHFRRRWSPLGERQPAQPVRTRADELYDAIKDYLLHEWQVPLVPTYADMTPALARALGSKLLDIRTAEELRRIVEDPAEAARLFDIVDHTVEESTVAPPAASAGHRDSRARLSEILTPDGRRLKVEAFGPALLRPQVRAQLGNIAAGLRLSESLKDVGGLSAKFLVAELGLSMDQLAVVLLVARETIGAEVFLRIFGHPGEAELIMRITHKARLAGLGQHSSLAECASFIRTLFAHFSHRR